MTTPLPRIRPGAESQFYRGNSIGCLLLHGFMASPAEVGWMGKYLTECCGYTVYVPRLTGHGVDPTHMNRMRWQDWYAQALDSYHLLTTQCEQIYIIGHSMGGCLAFLLAAQESVNGIISATTPITPPARLMRHTRVLSFVLPYTYNPSGKALHDEIVAEQTRRGERVIGRVHYARWSTRAVYELYRLMRITDEYLPRVKTPLLILTSAHDGTVLASDAQLIRERVQSPLIEAHEVKQGGHILFQDTGREEAFQIVRQFIQRLSTHQRMPGF